MAESESGSAEQYEKKRRGVIEFFNNFPFNKLLGMQLLEVEPGRARLSMSWRPDLCQPAGIIHGGAIASLVDTAIAHAILLTLPDVDSPTTGGRIVSVDLRLKYLRPVSEGQIFCDAHIVRAGRQIIHTAATVTNALGKEVALGDSIYMIVSGDQFRKRGA
ncbi:MAG: PaaI family thioesterase [Pirellulales bacterium]